MTSEVQAQHYMLARKVFAKMASESEINEFRDLRVRFQKPCDNLEQKAHECVVQHYRKLKHVFDTNQQGAEELQELKAFLDKHESPYSVACIRRRALTKKIGHRQAHRFNQKDSVTRQKMCLLLVKGKAKETDISRFIALYQKYGVTVEAEAARRVAALYLARRLEYLNVSLSTSRKADRDAMQKEVQNIKNVLMIHCGSVSQKQIVKQNLWLTSPTSPPKAEKVPRTDGLDTPDISSPDWDEIFDGN